ncbi:hypothetical protein [Acutalibacter sp. JLR.KK004]|uniref:hypothetical protein n=1 Tax=Acutalibacter sp. JLR.KK004 TaxID=3112622 RepID=UPI002FF33C81
MKSYYASIVRFHTKVKGFFLGPVHISACKRLFGGFLPSSLPKILEVRKVHLRIFDLILPKTCSKIHMLILCEHALKTASVSAALGNGQALIFPSKKKDNAQNPANTKTEKADRAAGILEWEAPPCQA